MNTPDFDALNDMWHRKPIDVNAPSKRLIGCDVFGVEQNVLHWSPKHHQSVKTAVVSILQNNRFCSWLDSRQALLNLFDSEPNNTRHALYKIHYLQLDKSVF